MKKIVLLFIIIAPLFAVAQKPDTKAEKKAARKQRIDELRKRAAEGEIVFDRQTAFGLKLNTDGYAAFLEIGRMKTLRKANLYSLELGERKHPKEEKISKGSILGFVGNPFIFGKINNFYFAKLGFSQQLMLGNKGNKNGVAVSAIYGGGFSAGLLKPYYLEIDHPTKGTIDVRYSDSTATYFLMPTAINGSSGFGKGWGEIKFVPGVHARTGLRFDYGRFNEMLSALEIGINAEFYTKTMPIMLLNKEKRFFFNAYVALEFGKRK